MTDLFTETREERLVLGPLATALAKAQSEFGTVTKDKQVTVTSQRTGRSYSFKYAPLDTILSVVREPLSKNGLALAQLLDGDSLVTMLIHESGASLEGRTPLPPNEDVQAYGSAITYMRRYAIQALLGIAAEEDDDGNRHQGNDTEPVTTQVGNETLELLGRVDVKGKAAKGGSDRYKGDWRDTPDGPAIGFALKRNGDKDMPQVLVVGDIAEALRVGQPELLGVEVRVKGRLYAVKQQGRTTYNRLVVGEALQDFIETPDVRIPPLADMSHTGHVWHQILPEQAVVDANPSAVSPLREAEGQTGAFDLEESARIDAEAAAAG